MKKLWLILVALWRIAVWWYKKDAETQAKRKEMKEAVNEAIRNNDTRALHRIMSRL